MAEKILIDTDPGVDDAMAILLALASPEVDVVGLTIVFGNSGDVHLLARNACAILELAQRSDIPVSVGATNPLLRTYHGRGATVHGDNALGGVELPQPQLQPIAQSAPQFIIDTCLTNSGEITLVPVGPLTNLALALRLYPELPKHVKQLSLMGGAAVVPGNSTPVAEANIHNDPEAARIVFNAGWPITMAGLGVTHQVYVGQSYLESLRDLGNRAGCLIHDSSRYYLEAYLQRGRPGLAMHDAHSVMVLIQPDLYESKHLYIDVETAGELTRGQTIADWDGHYQRPPQTHLLTKVYQDAFEKLFLERISRLV